jgi:hypothetical protein
MIQYKQDKTIYSRVQQFKLDLGFGFISVYVWKHREQLSANIITDEDNVVACYVPIPQRDPTAGPYGELHFVDDEVTVRHIAHELTHLAFDLYDYLNQEMVSHIIGDAFVVCLEEIFGIDYL